jgi:hypothetical protein
MALTEADFMAALHGYIVAVTGLDGGVVFRGNQSRMVLPKKGAYCIYTPIIRQRRGTNLYDFDAEGLPDDKNGTDSLTALVLVDVQVDFYADSAAQNAQMLEIASRSYMGTNYFKAAGVDVRVCTAQNPRNLTGIDASNQYEERWSVTITVEINSAITQLLPWFEDVKFQRVKEVIPPGGTEPVEVILPGIVNVDAEYPPTD